jgi:REase_AHJR-like protein
MTPSNVKESERDRLERIAADYQTQGYDVTVKPRADDLPDFLAGFAPDLIAAGKEGTIVVEVKARGELTGAPSSAGLEAALRNRPGWRFELIIDGSATEAQRLLSTAQIRSSLEVATELEKHRHTAEALLVLWSATEGALRFLADRENVELESLAPGYLLTRLYTLGLLGREEYQILDGAMRLRHQAAHGFQVAVTPENLKAIRAVLNGLLNEVEVNAA